MQNRRRDSTKRITFGAVSFMLSGVALDDSTLQFNAQGGVGIKLGVRSI